ncbi:MAG: dihydroorotate dehydrogenase electron transfer subunit [Candidatus Omnitrophota bacterium]
MRQLRSKIISNIKISSKYHKLIFKENRIANIIQPAQFLMLKVTESKEILLRRPFSVHRAMGKNIEIIYEVVGRGTEALAHRNKGEYLDVIGPLGNGFSIIDSRSSILVAGGIGVAPLMLLASKLQERRPKTKPCLPAGRDLRPLVLIGARTKKEILCEKEFKKLGYEVKISTDDGSKGLKGKVTELLKSILRVSSIKHQASTIYACGPRPMLKEIGKLAKKYRIPAQLSLEEHLACGIGACLGCVVKTKQGYQRVCKDGPVFNAQDLVWQGG